MNHAEETFVAQTHAFWIPRPDPNSKLRFRWIATEAACARIPGLTAPMGGVTNAAAIEAMERATGKSLLWSTTQFLNTAPIETDFDIEVEIVGGGRRTPQARATLRDGDRLILATSGALGDREEAGGQSFEAMPDVPAPESCPEHDGSSASLPGGLMSQFERRLANQDDERGNQSLWFRSVDAHPTCAGLLAILGDFISGAHPATRGSIGLDNTLRVVMTPDTEWILTDTHIAHIGPRAIHGRMNIFTETGQLMAIASITALRPRKTH